MRPKLRLRDCGVATLVAREQRAAVEDVALQPDICGERCADAKCAAAKATLVDQNFEF
jgi:hypothetical protein